MTHPQTSPPPPTPHYPATVPGRRVFIENQPLSSLLMRTHPDIENITPGDSIRLSDEEHARMQEMLKQPPIDLNDIFIEKVTMESKGWPQPIDYVLPDDLDKPESVCYNGEEKRWDDTVGQYPEQEVRGFVSRTLFLIDGWGHDFIGRSGDL